MYVAKPLRVIVFVMASGVHLKSKPIVQILDVLVCLDNVQGYGPILIARDCAPIKLEAGCYLLLKQCFKRLGCKASRAHLLGGVRDCFL